MPGQNANEGDVLRRAIEWIKANVELTDSNSVESLYDHMESQSGEQLPVIYVPFDAQTRGHFVDRGQIIDYAVVCGPGRVLDLGPGDGWPSLLMAPMVEEVVGVDGSKRRVDVCTENARRLGIQNASFVHVPPGEPLPFEDESFDGVAAASSIEQTPDPETTLRELYRVLKPGGRLRMHYESLGYYSGGAERELHIGEDRGTGDILIFDRHIEQEHVQHYQLAFDIPAEAVREVFARRGVEPPNATPEVLGDLRPHITDAATWITQHPSCRSWLLMLRKAGFSSAATTYDGGWFAHRLFDRLPEAKRPRQIDAVDEMLRPLVEVVVTMEAPSVSAPGGWEPLITAVN
jgi:SAM-dependent methyltransferase